MTGADPNIDFLSDATTATGCDRLGRIGVIGLGRMGEAFARNLLQAGFDVSVFDRNADRRERLAQAGAQALDGLGGASALDAVITSLSNDEAVASVALGGGGLADVLKAGAVHVSMSTVSPDLCRRLAEAHGRAGQRFVAAPVLGNPDLARARRLFVIASGNPDDAQTVAPMLHQLGRRVFYLGADPGAASVMKLGANALTALTLQSLGEVLAFLRKSGVDGQTAFEVLTGSLFDGEVHKTYGGKIVAERYAPPGMTATLAAKDLRLVLAEAERASAPMPATSLVRDRVVAMTARGWADLDWSALGLLAAEDAGLAPAGPQPANAGEDATQ